MTRNQKRKLQEDKDVEEVKDFIMRYTNALWGFPSETEKEQNEYILNCYRAFIIFGKEAFEEMIINVKSMIENDSDIDFFFKSICEITDNFIKYRTSNQ
jgi:hypothetical protein